MMIGMNAARVLVLLVLLVLSAAAQASAQTVHPCDEIFPASGTLVEGQATIEMCFAPKDAAGNAITIKSHALYVDDVRFAITGVASGLPSPVSGRQLYRTGVLLVKGSHKYQAAAIDDKGVEGEKGGPFSLTVTPQLGPPVAGAIRGFRQP